jgi:hypothetical protein
MEKFEIVPMSEVPDPPVSRVNNAHAQLYERVKALGLGEREALRVPVKDAKALAYTRSTLRKMAERDGRMLCSSRNHESTVLFVWLVKKGAK